jgi:rhamnose utilization protein RhaD (predicted bifunctional aldolase and dehydrogenase)/NAD(P)-dependent dehydrogenase (short-subunit alcohol dehydrogenase family)
MQSRWNDADAAAAIRRHAEAGEDVALRVYTSQLIGSDSQLVLHGGGNTSVKTTARDLLGRSIAVLHVKGSGSDLASVAPRDLPAVRLQPLLELRALPTLDDRAMVSAVRGALLDSDAPNPSVEALLHAFLPHKFVDHTHADAILALTDQPDPAMHVQAAFGDDVALLPWIMPGFPLAKAVADAFERQPHVQGVVLAKHGLFTFGDDARTSYERTIARVDRAERHLARQLGGPPPMLAGTPAPLPAVARRAAWREVLPVLRGALAGSRTTPWGDEPVRSIADLRDDDAVANWSSHPDAARLCATGPITPDHVIRTKGPYLFLRRDEARDGERARSAVHGYVHRYRQYYDRHCRARAGGVELPPEPVVVVVEGLGLAAFRPDAKAARIAADIAVASVRTKALAEALERYVPLADADLAEMEYWPLELAKLGKSQAPPLQGQVAFVTGAAGAIGCGIVEALLAHGACVFATDRDGERLAAAAARWSAHRGRFATGVGDVGDAPAVAQLVDACVLAFGGIDCVVPNAGIARTGRLEDLPPAAFAEVMAVNAQATFVLLQQTAAVLRAQGTGGSVVVQASKNVFAPGAGFGAYSASKAAALQLARIAALEFAAFGVRVNAINADAVFGDADVPSQLWAAVGPERMAARGLDAAGLRSYYRERSLLKTEVLPRHVGEAVAFFAAARTPTTGAVLPVDGGLPEAFPR